MAFVSAGTALDAAVERHFEGLRSGHQFAHFCDRNIVPVVYKLARKPQTFLMLGRGHKRLRVRHGVRLETRVIRDIPQFRSFKFYRHVVSCTARSGGPAAGNMPPLARIIDLIPGRIEKHPRGVE